MLHRYFYTLFLFTAFTFSAFSQLDKGDQLYNEMRYFEAIPFYKKEVRSKKSERKQEALIKIANCYRLINDYKNAEESYKQALDIDGITFPAEAYYNYAQVLKINGKYPEASQQLSEYIKLTPNDENARRTLKFCNEIKYYASKPAEYAVKNIQSINTDKAEFSPVVTGNKLMFVAERESFDFVNYEVNSYDGQPFIHMYVSSIDGEKINKNSKSLSKKINSDFHVGPASITSDGHMLYFTRVTGIEKKGFTNTSKIFIADGNDRNWKNIRAFDFNSDEYSVAHPSIANDNVTLFFVSNMPGGFGGKDIWYSVFDTVSKVWSKPLNLGPDINTSGDEMFPSLRKDGILFFSSNGLPGFGGLDIYTAKKVGGQWLLERNEGLELNSSADDFGVTFLNDSVGYFSSNRVGGKGKDDIYSYRFTPKSILVSGTVLLSENVKDYAKSKKVLLVDENGKVVDSTQTNESGYFVFKNLPNDKKYMAVIDEDDINIKGTNPKYFLAGNDSTAKRVTVKLPNGKFAFKNLPLDPNGLPQLNTEEDNAFAGKLLSGDSKKAPMKNVKLKVLNDKGELLEETTTDENGTFVFKNIPPDANYLITIDEGDVKLDEGTKITLTNKAGKEVKSFYKTKDNFAFKVLPSEKNTLADMTEEDIAFAGTLKTEGKDGKILKNVKVKILNQKGEVIGETTTDETGAFAFRNIPGDQNFIVAIDEGDVQLPEGTRVSMTNKAGKEVKSFVKEKEAFSFKVLASEKEFLKEMDIEDADLSMGLVGFIYDQDKRPLANTKVKVKNEDGTNPLQTLTNPSGKFTFNKLNADKNYLFELDENDPSLQGVSKVSIADAKGRVYKTIEMVSGKFAFKILESDKNAMGEFTMDDPKLIAARRKKVEEEKKKEVVMGLNGFLFDQNNNPLENATIKVKDLNGANEQKTQTGAKGRFKFDNLNADKNYMFELDENDPVLRGVSRVSIADGTGRVYKVVEMMGGKFAFKILEADKNVMGEYSGADPALVARKKKAQVEQKKEVQMGLVGFLFDQNQKPIENAAIKVKDNNGANEQQTRTVKEGKFRFDNLSADKNYMFEIDENDPALRGVTKVSIADASGKIYKIVEMAGGKFAFKILEADRYVMGEFTGADPTLVARKKKIQEKQKEVIAKAEPIVVKSEIPVAPTVEEEEEIETEISVTIIENIYYAYGSFSVTPDAEVTLNKAIDALLENDKLIMEISSHTDSQSSSGFNLNLSRKRAQAAVNYLVSKGIAAKRVKATGYGETRLLNKCVDGAVCSDEEHRINRRTEFKITKTVK